MKEIVKNRKWVKWAAAGFLTVMLILTFFSNTIMNAALPQVKGTLEVKLPFVGGLTFDRTEVDKLYRYMKGEM